MSLKQINTYKEESYINPKSSTIVYEFQYNISFRQLLHFRTSLWDFSALYAKLSNRYHGFVYQSINLSKDHGA